MSIANHSGSQFLFREDTWFQFHWSEQVTWLPLMLRRQESEARKENLKYLVDSTESYLCICLIQVESPSIGPKCGIQDVSSLALPLYCYIEHRFCVHVLVHVQTYCSLTFKNIMDVVRLVINVIFFSLTVFFNLQFLKIILL